MFSLNSTFQNFHFLVEISYLLANSLFQLSIFVKCHMSLSLGDKEATQQHTFMSICELNNRWAVTPLTDWKKRHEWWSLVITNICYMHSDLWTKELVAKFVSMQLIS